MLGQRARLSAAVLALALASAVFTSGCVNLPYIESTRHAPPGTPSKGSLEDAVGYADRTYDAYELKIVEEWRRQQSLSTGLIGVGAVAIGAGLAQAHRDVFKVLGLGSAAAYQLGNWNHNSGRIGIYLDGMKAMVCVKTAVQPLRMGKEARSRIRTAMNLVGAATKTAAHAVAKAGPARVSSADSAAMSMLQVELTGLQAELEEARQQQLRAASVEQRIDGAGAMLQQKIDELRAVIDKALHDSQAVDTVNLKAAIQAMAAYATQFTADAQGAGLAISKGLAAKQEPSDGTTAGKESAPAKDAVPDATLGQALGAVSGARIELTAATAQLKGTIDRQFEGVSASLGNCGVDTSKLATALRLEEAAVSLKAGQARTAVILAKGGTRPLSVRPVTAPTPGLSVSISPEGGSVILVADTKTEAGDYVFKVTDQAEQSSTLTVTVEAHAAGTNTVDRESAPSAALCRGLEDLSPVKICFLQSLLELAPVDGKAGPKTCEKFKAAVGRRASTMRAGFELFAKQADLGAGSSEDDYLRKLGRQDEADCRKALRAGKRSITDNVAGNSTKNPVASPSVESQLSGDQIAFLAKVLNRPGAKDLAGLREALASNQAAHNCPSTQGVFTESEVRRLYRPADQRHCKG
jgi:hypothetical protein